MYVFDNIVIAPNTGFHLFNMCIKFCVEDGELFCEILRANKVEDSDSTITVETGTVISRDDICLYKIQAADNIIKNEKRIAFQVDNLEVWFRLEHGQIIMSTYLMDIHTFKYEESKRQIYLH